MIQRNKSDLPKPIISMVSRTVIAYRCAAFAMLRQQTPGSAIRFSINVNREIEHFVVPNGIANPSDLKPQDYKSCGTVLFTIGPSEDKPIVKLHCVKGSLILAESSLRSAAQHLQCCANKLQDLRSVFQ